MNYFFLVPAASIPVHVRQIPFIVFSFCGDHAPNYSFRFWANRYLRVCVRACLPANMRENIQGNWWDDFWLIVRIIPVWACSSSAESGKDPLTIRPPREEVMSHCIWTDIRLGSPNLAAPGEVRHGKFLWSGSDHCGTGVGFCKWILQCRMRTRDLGTG